MTDLRPVLFVTGIVPPDRVGAFAALHERTPVELALFGGGHHHATADVADPGVPHRRVGEGEILRLAAAGDHRAVVCGTAGRRALPGAWAGARRAGVPFVLWSALWAPVRSAAGLAGEPLLRRIHRDAHAVATYGEHVSSYARRLGARRTVVAPQAVDGAWWSALPRSPASADGALVAAFVGRDTPGKGAEVAEAALAAGPDGARLLTTAPGPPRPGVERTPAATPEQVRVLLARADVLLVPSVRTRTFREPWGLVVNEAFHAGVPVIASDEVGAVAGGLVVDGRNGLVVPAGDVAATAAALHRLAADSALRAGMGRTARADVAPYTYAAWADGMLAALA